MSDQPTDSGTPVEAPAAPAADVYVVDQVVDQVIDAYMPPQAEYVQASEPPWVARTPYG